MPVVSTLRQWLKNFWKFRWNTYTALETTDFHDNTLIHDINGPVEIESTQTNQIGWLASTRVCIETTLLMLKQNVTVTGLDFVHYLLFVMAVLTIITFDGLLIGALICGHLVASLFLGTFMIFSE